MILWISVVLAGEVRSARALTDAATKYWEGVRWTEPGRATPYLALSEARIRFEQLLAEGQVRLTGATVVAADMDPVPKDKSPRPATVMVRIEIVDLQTNRLETVNYVQGWREVESRWFVDLERSPLGTDRVWVVEPSPK